MLMIMIKHLDSIINLLIKKFIESNNGDDLEYTYQKES